jgi:hypothetical protein
MSIDRIKGKKRPPTRLRDRHGRLVVVELLPRVVGQRPGCRCECDCGAEKIAALADLRASRTSSCGCLAHDVLVARNTSHGLTNTATYRAWSNMLTRCRRREGEIGWKDYAGRGIRVCAAWLTFDGFLKDMGECPPGYTLERKDVDKNYEPGNCRWATKLEQARNKRTNRYLEHGGERLMITEWAARLGVDASTINARLKLGWSVGRAVAEPVRRKEVARAC